MTFAAGGMESFVQDLKYGLRSLRKAPGFTAVAVLALALGIGANTVLFSVISFSLLRPVPFPDPDRLVIVNQTAPSFSNSSCAWLNYLDWKAQVAPLFTHFAAERRDSFNLTGAGGEPERVLGRMATSELLPQLGIQPVLGRLYGPEEDKPGAPRTVLLSHGLWQRRFGGDPAVVGSSIQLSGDSYTVLGVLPRDLRFLSGGDVWVPLGLFAERYQDRGINPGIYVFGRLAPGVSVQRANDALNQAMRRIAETAPDMKGEGVRARLFSEDQVEGSRPALLVLWGAVAFVLLIAAANVANLLLSRAAARQQEIAVRVALGAGRLRIVRQLLTESVLLSFAGALLGTLLAWLALGALSPLLANLPRGKDVRLDALALAFTVGVALVTGVGFGIYPAVRASNPHIHTLLKEVRAAGAHARLRGALIVAEVALSMMLLVGAGLTLRSFARLTRVDPGFDAAHLLTTQIALPAARYRDGASITKFLQELRRRVALVPGVESAAVAAGMPILGTADTSYAFEGLEPPDRNQWAHASIYPVTAGYFETLRIPLIHGRYFTEADRGRDVAIIDDRMARRAFGNADPVGRRMAGNQPFMAPLEIVGVVGHVENYSLDGKGPVDSGYYVEHDRLGKLFPQFAVQAILAVRTAGDPMTLAAAVRRTVQEIDPLQPVYSQQSMEQVVSDSMSDRRLMLLLLGIFAVVALLLASVGIYGVMSYSVEQRTREIGIRMALGAERAAVLRMILGQGTRLAAVGIAVGLLGAFALSRLMSRFLYGISATDPSTYALLALLLAAVAVAACLLPASRAVKVDPVIALRAE
ncbi:MAG TPA: ABC transporter permease [Myxococcales bacterium]|jgi:putative ABC transport system permease protein|nr:ABC transporter permease [Myxococcales bacterium]